MNLKSLERLLPPNPPLSGHWARYRCDACQAVTRLDLRVNRLPAVGLLRRAGLVRLACPVCGSASLTAVGIVVS